MHKYKTVKLLLVSLLSASAIQAVAADYPAVEGIAPAPGETVQANSHWIDFSDPTAIFSKVGMGAGTEGVDVYASLGGYLSGQFEQKLTVEAKHDMDYHNINYLAFNSSNDTGFMIDSSWRDDYDEVSIAVIKKLLFAQNENLKVYPAMRFGHMWDWDDSIPSTSFVELDATVRFTVNRNLWFGAAPTYRYAMDGLDIESFDVTADIGYQLAEEVAISAHVNDHQELWADFTFAF